VTLLESVPNVSEGRDRDVVADIGRALGRHGRVLDVHSDADHHRSVFTLVAEDSSIVEALLAGIARAAETIDLRSHDGIHPRVGAADVVPIVPLRSGEMSLAKEAALELGRRVGGELGLPVFLYGESGEGRRPAFFRRGGPAELQRRIETEGLAPAFGPPRLDPRAGAVLIGARPTLVALNLELSSGALADAQAIAAAVRASGGGMPGVQALGLELPGSGRIQVSINVIDLDAAPLVDVVERVREEASRRDVTVGPGELVGLLPERAVAEPERLGLAELPDERVLERRIAELTPLG
jgi:glutamate formiminotransferase